MVVKCTSVGRLKKLFVTKFVILRLAYVDQ